MSEPTCGNVNAGLLIEAVNDGLCPSAGGPAPFLLHKDGGGMLGTKGLVEVLEEVGYPATRDFDAIAGRLLTSSDRIRFDDDVTFLEIRMA